MATTVATNSTTIKLPMVTWTGTNCPGHVYVHSTGPGLRSSSCLICANSLCRDEDLEDLRAASKTRGKFLREGRAAFLTADQHKAKGDITNGHDANLPPL